MRIRHLVERENVDARGFVRDATAIRHGLIIGRRVSALAGPIDPATHLNRDFHEHLVDDCVVVERFVVGAPVVLDGDRFAIAQVATVAFAHRGPVDVDARRARWLALRQREGRSP